MDKSRANSKVIKITSPEEASRVIQTYILTTAKYDFSVFEKRILYYCVYVAQECLQGEKLEGLTFDKLRKKPKKEITMPIKYILQGEEDHNHMAVKNALLALMDKKIVFENSSIWGAMHLISDPIIKKYDKVVTFEVSNIIWRCILDFSRGFHAFELQVAMKFKSVYSMRFYEYVSNPKKEFHPTLAIDDIKRWFCIEDKYKETKDFIKRVIEPAKKDLDEKAPWSFDYEKIKLPGNRKYTHIKIIPKRCPQNENKKLQASLEERRTNFSWTVKDKEVRLYLTDIIGFTQTELKNTRDIWGDAYSIFGQELRTILQDKLIVARQLQSEGRLKKDIKSYIVGAIKSMVEAVKKTNPVNDMADKIVDKLANK